VTLTSGYLKLDPGVYIPTFSGTEPKMVCHLNTNQSTTEVIGKVTTTSGTVDLTVLAWQVWSQGIDKTTVQSFEVYALASGRTVECLMGW